MGVSSLEDKWCFDFAITDEYYFSDGGRIDWNMEDILVLGHVPLVECIDGLPPEARQHALCGSKSAPRTTPSVSSQAACLRKNPWTMEFLADDQAIRAREQTAGDEEVAPEDGKECEELDMLDGEALFEAMRQAHRATEGEGHRALQNATKWTLQNVGVACYAYQRRAFRIEAVVRAVQDRTAVALCDRFVRAICRCR